MMAATEVSLEGSLVARLVIELAYQLVEWEGTPTELFELLTDQVGRGVAMSSAWPKSTQYFMNEVRRLAPQLRMLGVFVVSSRTRARRRVQVTRVEHLGLVAELEARRSGFRVNEAVNVRKTASSRPKFGHHMVLHLGLRVFQIIDRHALNASRIIGYDDKRRGSDYSIVTLKSNGGKDVTPDCGFGGRKVLAPVPAGFAITFWLASISFPGL